MNYRPKIELVPDARRVVFGSYSFWAAAIALFALVGREALYKATGYDLSPVFAILVQIGMLLFILVGRVMVQRVTGWRNALRITAVTVLIVLSALTISASLARASSYPVPRRATAPETMAIAVPLLFELEGMRLQAYRDIVGVPTICAGTTRGVRMGDVKTLAECEALARSELLEYREIWHGYLTDETLDFRVPPKRDAAFTTFAINVGADSAGRSTATRRLNAGNVAGACEAMTWWNRAGNRVVLGLVNRRKREKSLCLAG